MVDCIPVNFKLSQILKGNGSVCLRLLDGSLAVNDNLCFLTGDSSVKSLRTELGDSSFSFVNEVSATDSAVFDARGERPCVPNG